MKKIILIACMLLVAVMCCAQVVTKSYHDNGKLREINTYDDNLKLNGVCKSWNASGVLTAKAYYVNGKKHGKWKIWYDNGKLAYVINYRNGNKHGVSKMYGENGELIASQKY